MIIRNAKGQPCKEKAYRLDAESGKLALELKFQKLVEVEALIRAFGRLREDWTATPRPPGWWSSVTLTVSEFREPKRTKKATRKPKAKAAR